MQPGYDPYAAPQALPFAPEDARPGVVVWARVYAVAFALMYLACAVGGVFILSLDDEVHGEKGSAVVQGVIMAGLGVVLMALSIVALVAPRKKWGWIVNVVLIGLGCSSCMCMPAAIPLLIFWLKPETKRWFAA
jgi:MFS family permease